MVIGNWNLCRGVGLNWLERLGGEREHEELGFLLLLPGILLL